MKPPRFPPDHPGHMRELETELEPFLIELVDRVVRAGWSKDAIWTALISLVAELEYSTFEKLENDELVLEAMSHLECLP